MGCALALAHLREQVLAERHRDDVRSGDAGDDRPARKRAPLDFRLVQQLGLMQERVFAAADRLLVEFDGLVLLGGRLDTPSMRRAASSTGSLAPGGSIPLRTATAGCGVYS